MKKASLVVHQNYLEDVIKKLHETGMIEIIDISRDEPETLEELEKGSMHPDAETCTLYEIRLSRLIDILKKITPKTGGIKAFLHPELPNVKTIEDCTLDEIFSYAEGTLGEIEKQIIEKEENLIKLNEEKENILDKINQLEYIKDFDLDVSDIGQSEYVVIRTGLTMDLDVVKEKLQENEKTALLSKQFGTKKKIQWAVIIIGHVSHVENIEKICREHVSEFDFQDLSGRPKELIISLKQRLKDIETEKKKIINGLRVYAKDQLDDLLSLREEIQLERVRRTISRSFGKTSSTYIIKGWVLEKDEKHLNDEITQVSSDHVICNFETPSPNPDNPPTYFKTPKWADGFKGLLNMFALPRYNEINPTVIMGFFFILFFGIMLGDGGYGLIILVLALFGYFKLGKHSDMIRSWSFMGIWMGLVTTVFGLLTNSFFGDFVPRFIYGNPNLPLYPSFELFGASFPLNPIKDPLTILGIALVFGLIHLNVGVILGLVQAAKRRKYNEMLTARFCWIPFQIGGGLLISNFILDVQLSNVLFIIAVVLVVIGFIQLLLSAGPIGFFDITGYVGDWLSYARLLALGLATAGMALAFNVIAELMGKMIPYIGIIITVILLIIAHMVNLGLQALGAGIHSLRLQYVEFFNRFYEGGGHEFAPFKIRRKYTKIKEKED
jgi:V/A-type H+-transporting ATPase subunit I